MDAYKPPNINSISQRFLNVNRKLCLMTDFSVLYQNNLLVLYNIPG